MSTEFPIHTFLHGQLNHDLWNVPFPSSQIQIQGKLEALSLLEKVPWRGFAVVGTRIPQSRTLHLIDRWIEELRGSDLVIVSGLARGIDTRAHEAALRSGLPTIAVIGCGIRAPTYPSDNESLRKEILQAGGLVISEFAPLAPPAPENFIRRNRLIAGWSKATWIVEASHRSGALNTANWARKLARDCYVTPCFPGDPALAGNQKLLERAQAHAFVCPRNLAGTWGEFASWFERKDRMRRIQRHRDALSPDAKTLTAQVRRLTSSQGGVLVPHLLDWAFSIGWMPERFFFALENALKSQLIHEHNGALSTNELPKTNN